jgi:ABC-type multidrug transport system ATPase subunit
VSQTLTFALANNTPNRESRPFKKDEATVPTAAEVDAEAEQKLLKIFGLSHTADTKVGDSYVRGVSGGQRKRVSLAEVLAGRPSVQLWDKPTRGLDANTALEFIKILRVLADVQRNAIVVSLYQAGNVITNLFDKILVLAEGETIYYGPQAEAKPYMESLGFQMLGKRSLTWSFLVSELTGRLST